MKREIVHFPDPVLHRKARPVEKVTDEIRELLNDMADTMYAEDGVGLAAPQIGVSLRLAVIDVSGSDGDRGLGLLKLVNPEIVAREGEIEYEEGCLSVPGLFHDVERPASVVVQAQDVNGKVFTVKADGLLARAIQHENDHLNGVLFIDRLEQGEQEKMQKAWEKRSRRRRSG